MSDRTQNEEVLARLKQGPLTALEALDELGCLRLAARVYTLRLDGWPIDRRTLTTNSGKRVAQYYLLKGGRLE